MQQYKDFLDGSGPEGAVFISFGSTIRLEKVSGPYSKMFFEVIKKHKNVRFLLKWEGPFPEGFEAADMRNLMVSPWVPQREILSEYMKNYNCEKMYDDTLNFRTS